MRTMYDSVDPFEIPVEAQMVAGYVDPDGDFTWSQAGWDRFPNAVKVRIAGHATTNDGHVLDVEFGDALPSEAPAWCTMRRKSGLLSPSVYCSVAFWDEVKQAFATQSVPEPEWWVAAYPGIGPQLYPGSVAHQYQDVGPYDLSVVADYWPGVDDVPVPPTTKRIEDNVMWIAYLQDKNYCDVYYAGVLVDGFPNTDNPNQFNVGQRFQQYLNQGVPWTHFATEAEYSGARARLSKFTSA